MNLSRNLLSSLITGFSLGIMLLLMVNIRLQADIEEEYIIEMELLDEEQEPEKKELADAGTINNSSISSHRALNETAKPTIPAPEPLKTLDELLAEQEESNPSEPGVGPDAFSTQLRDIKNRRSLNQQELEIKESEKTNYTDFLKDRQTSISYSLLDRNSLDLPPPIYTCIEGGKVVVNIVVDNRGFVLQAQFNEKSSNTANGCLVENAIAYALQSRFNASAKLSQIGTITYIFQGK
jgi:hypothetical protein